MRCPRRSDKLHVLVAGGGVAALEAMVALRKLAGELVEVELLSPDTDFFYRPLSVAEPFGLGERPALRPDVPGAWVRRATQPRQPGRRRADDGGPDGPKRVLHYDALLIAIGARPREAIPGALTFRGEADVRLVTGLLSDLDRGLVGTSSSPYRVEPPGRCPSTSWRS